MGRNLHWSIIAASEDQHLAGGGKMRAQGIVDSMLKSLASARGRNPDGRSRCGSEVAARAGQPTSSWRED
jgi:hypothetical protein